MKRPRLTTLPSRIAVAPSRIASTIPKVADRFYSSPEWLSLMRKLKFERGERCQQCERTNTRIFGDHVRELADGGAPLNPNNVMLMCGACHTIKTNAEKAKRAAKRHVRDEI